MHPGVSRWTATTTWSVQSLAQHSARDYTITPRVYLRALLAVRADSGAGPAGLPSKYIHAQPPITHDRSADLLHAALNSPESILVGDQMSCVSSLPKRPDAAT